MSVYVPVALRKQVIDRAQGIFAYCSNPEELMGVIFEIEHIIPRSAGGETSSENLCLSCPACNRYKGTRLTAKDPVSGNEIPLFHPLKQDWNEHFTWSDNGTQILGLTPIGRATIKAFRMNRPMIVRLRGYWVALNLYPPK
jgi:hypothetical protein